MEAVVLGRVLVVDDETELMSALSEMVSAQGYETEGFTSGADALEALKDRHFDLLLTDLMMPATDGITLLRQGLAIDPYLTGIIMTGQGTVQTAVDAMKVGAFDYILKPFKLSALLPVLSRAMEVRRLKMENLQLRQTIGIYELGQTISYTLDLRAILDKVADGALQQCEANEASIMLPTREGRELYVAAVRGRNRHLLLGRRVPADKNIAGWVAHHREPLVLRGKVQDPRFAPAAERDDIFLAVSLPFMVGGKLAGILNLNFTQPRRQLTIGELKALSILAAIAGTALESARLHGEIRIAEERYRSIFENAIDGIFQTSPDGQSFTTVNAAMARILGYDSPEHLMAAVAGIGPHVFLEPSCREKLMTTLETRDAVSEFECQWRRRDGMAIWVSINLHGVRDSKGKVQGYEGMIEDITERRVAEEELAKERNLLRTLINNLPDSIYFKDLQSRFITTNTAHQRFLGAKSLDEVVGKMDLDFLPKELAQRYYAEERDVVKSGKALVNREEPVRQGDAKKWVLTTLVPLRGDGGAVEGIVGVSRDITEHKNLELQLLQAQKMEAVGQLAGGVAHDFNNILTAIIGYATFLQMKLKDDDPLKHFADQVIAAAHKAAHLTQSLLAFSRKQIINPKPVDLNEIIRRLEKFLIRIIGEDIELSAAFAEGDLVVLADSGPIEQILMNLATNARDAMPQGGLLTISTSRLTLDAEFVKAHGYGEPGKYALISFEDSGIGMDKKTQEKIFEPFFTTKEVGKGTGLGLSIVYGIVKQHNGYINVYSEHGRGTTFRIYLPLIQSAVEEAKRGDDAAPTGGTETILLGEDDPGVRSLTKMILEQSGYTVIEAIDGDEAVAKFMENRERIGLLLLDIVMPKKNGKAVSDEIKQVSPEVRALFTSGYTANVVHQKGILDKGLNFITKPFSPSDLLQKVREVLDR